ncbi:DivIVA domain-containing protein [Nocardia spumae]|uniref:DivIVA domain-containing protein n=1 Tax=Nocardia spumae TaxID=2887190 RepID=UPI0035591961
MLTLLLYVLIVGLVAALLFLVASAVFGRGEELGPLPEGTTVTVLPAAGIRGSDVRALRFQQVFRGYKAGEVDWALSRLAARIDELETQLAQGSPSTAASDPASPGSGGMSAPGAEIEPHGPANGTATNFSTGFANTISGFPTAPGQLAPGFGGPPAPAGPPFNGGAGFVPPTVTGFGSGPVPSTPPTDPTTGGYPGIPGTGFGVATPGTPTTSAYGFPGAAQAAPGVGGHVPPGTGTFPATPGPGQPTANTPAVPPATGASSAAAEASGTGSWAPPPLPGDPPPGTGAPR